MAPSVTVRRLWGTAVGVSTPASRITITSTTASPTKRTSLPRTPVFQPSAEIVTPSPSPVYQPVNEDTARTIPATSARPSPSPNSPVSKRRSRNITPEPISDAAGAGATVNHLVCFLHVRRGAPAGGRGGRGRARARGRPVARCRCRSTLLPASPRAAARAHRARPPEPAGGHALLGRAGAPRGGMCGAGDDDVARDRAPLRAVGTAPSSSVRTASLALVAVIAVLVPVTLIANGLAVVASDAFVRWELGRDGFPSDRYGLSDEQRKELALLGLRSIEPGSEGVVLLERATLPDGSPAFDARELAHMEDVRTLFVPLQ